MAHWVNIEPSLVGEWVGHMMQRELPSAYSIAPPSELGERALHGLEALGLTGDVEMSSGSVRITQISGAQAELIESALALADILDPGRVWVDARAAGPGELPEFVQEERWSRVDYLPVLGPGGRIIVSRLGSELDADVVCRTRMDNLGGQWRRPEQIAAAVRVMMAGAPFDASLRADFGYSEPGRYTECTVLRPYFVFLLERPQDGEGPGWRYALECPATSLDADGPAGHGGSTGTDSGCV